MRYLAILWKLILGISCDLIILIFFLPIASDLQKKNLNKKEKNDSLIADVMFAT